MNGHQEPSRIAQLVQLLGRADARQGDIGRSPREDLAMRVEAFEEGIDTVAAVRRRLFLEVARVLQSEEGSAKQVGANERAVGRRDNLR